MNQKKLKKRLFGGWDASVPSRTFMAVARQLALGAAVCLTVAGTATGAATDLPRTDDALIETIKSAMTARDFEPFEKLVYWEGAGKIKRRIVKFQIRRGFGRKIDTIALEDFPEDGMASIDEIDHLRVNMPVTHRVRVTFDEPPINDQGKLPTSVYLVGKKDGAYRIALVVRNFDDDDDDD